LIEACGKGPAELREVGFAKTILLGQQPQRFAHDLALVVVETRRDLALDEFLELSGQVGRKCWRSSGSQ